MQTAHGTVKHFKEIHSVNGSNDHVTTTHHAYFTLGHYSVQITSVNPIMLSEGDTVSLAGNLHGDVFTAHAWYNHTACHQGDDINLAMVGVGVFFFVMAFSILVSVGTETLHVLGCGLLISVSLWCGFSLQRSWHAKRILEAFLASGSDEWW